MLVNDVGSVIRAKNAATDEMKELASMRSTTAGMISQTAAGFGGASASGGGTSVSGSGFAVGPAHSYFYREMAQKVSESVGRIGMTSCRSRSVSGCPHAFFPLDCHVRTRVSPKKSHSVPQLLTRHLTQVGHSQRDGVSVCSPSNALLFVPRRALEETGSVPVHHPQDGTDVRRCDEDRGEPDLGFQRAEQRP